MRLDGLTALCVAAVQESMHYFKYKTAENVLYEYGDDVAPRHITAALPLDYDTVAAADKFCNVFITRLPAEVSAQARASRRFLSWILPGRLGLLSV